MQIQISWLLQKPSDLDIHCLQRQGISGLSRTRVKTVLNESCSGVAFLRSQDNILCGTRISLVMACVNEYSFLSHLSHCDKVSFCDHTLSVIGSESVHACVRASLSASVNNFFKRHLFLNH